MKPNRLIHEQSPYLLQHAYNPVDWYPWGEEAFAKARREDKPIFLSIGYSTCHWCHVMERESFENEEIAALLNRHFVPVKVDREERPDVDRIYMMFVQATTGSGGWPMSVWLTPDRKPFFGGTYFPPDNRWGRPGFRYILERLAEAWRTDRSRLMESGDDILAQLSSFERSRDASAPLSADLLDRAFLLFRRMFDPRYGGFGSAPKFPRPSVHNFLLREALRSGNQEAADMVLETLTQMARGGMNDQLGGGFHRYSVDERWFVPHFEKMLYDQAQLAVSYLEAWQLTHQPHYAAEARRILDYVLRDMTNPSGAFYSAEDADSVIHPDRPHEKGEGAFYLWSHQEIHQLLGEPSASWFAFRFGVLPHGNVTHDPHQEFTGKNILYQAYSLEETATRFSADPLTLETALNHAAQTLLAARAARPRPHLDDKILTAWNGLMISAFALAAQALAEPRYLQAASRAAAFILQQLYSPDSGLLLRRFRSGDAAIPGFLDDYAFLAQACLDLYETTFDTHYLELALQLTAHMRRRFEDPAGGFFSTASDHTDLLLRLKDDYDGAEPSGNSIAALNLLRLAHFTGNRELEDCALRTLAAFSSRLAQHPAQLPQMLAALAFSLKPPRQIVIAGQPDAPDTRALLQVVRSRFLPHKIVILLGSPAQRDFFAPLHPPLAAMTPIAGKAAAYVCENFACRLPATDPGQLAELLK